MIRFVWFDLLSNAHDAAIAFYRNVLDVVPVDSGLEDRRLTIFTKNEAMVSGVRDITNVLEHNPTAPFWLGYLAVGNVDMYTSDIAKAGGSILRPPEDIPQVGRYSVVADPQGAVFALFYNPQVMSMAPPKAETLQAGHVVYKELQTANEERAALFYSETFNWRAGINSRLHGMANARWVYAFRTDDLAASSARVTMFGGTLLGPTHAHAGGALQICADPEGAVFGLSTVI